jgi:hypothetical protein
MSPKFLDQNGFSFSIFSNEENRMHVHVFKDENEAKIWLEPAVELAYNNGFKAKEMKQITSIVNSNEEEFKEKYRKHVG